MGDEHVEGFITRDRRDHATDALATNHPSFVLHFSRASSWWLNLVECWFAELTTNSCGDGTHPHALAGYGMAVGSSCVAGLSARTRS